MFSTPVTGNVEVVLDLNGVDGSSIEGSLNGIWLHSLVWFSVADYSDLFAGKLVLLVLQI